MDFVEVVAALMADETLAEPDLRALVEASVADLEPAADAEGESLDYVLEAMLEAVASQPALLATVHGRIADYWLRLDAVPGGTHLEVVVRAAECLAAAHTAAGTGLDTLEAMATDRDWRQRLVAAWTLRDRTDPDAVRLRAGLARDPFEDDDGAYLVREGAGFDED